MRISKQDWEDRKHHARFTEEDAATLKSLEPKMAENVDDIVNSLYKHWSDSPHLKGFLSDPTVVARLRKTQTDYFMELFGGVYDDAYCAKRVRVGLVHQQIGLCIQWYIGAFSNYIEEILPVIFKVIEDKSEAVRAATALVKLIHLDEEITVLSYFEAREDIIEKQHEEIISLSTPVVSLWEGVVAAPIIGNLDSFRTQLFMERLLETIVETKSPIALIDITGVPAIDTATAQHLIDTMNSVNLLGTKVVITGVSPAIAQTLVHLGIDLKGVRTCSSLSTGLAVAFEELKLTVTDSTKTGV